MLLHFIICLITFPLAIAIGTLQVSTSNAINNIAKPGCPTQCGNVTVPYPFGFGDDPSCSLDDLFHMTCTNSQLFLRTSDIRIHDFSESELRIFSNVSYKCYNQDGSVSNHYTWDLWLKSFTISEKNKFTVIGCDDYGLITGTHKKHYYNGCIGLCSSNTSDIPDENCSGNGCCQTSITKGLDKYYINLSTYNRHRYVWPTNNCGYGFLGEENSFQFRGASDLSNSTDLVQRVESNVTIVLDWVIASNQSCSNATECKANSHCNHVDDGGYRCSCNQGYEGNPYLDEGCQDINECNDAKTYSCYGTCVNTNGNFTCNCKEGYYGDPKTKDGCQRESTSMLRLLLGIGFGFLTVLIGSCIVYYTAKKRKLLMLRERFFEQNGGVLLEDKLKNNGAMGVGSMQIFRVEELKEATRNYAEDMILGKGGNGTVYKGILPDKHVVAIKKSQKLDQGQREQFINEMIILTQINHQNVVQLLGCCLETDVPLLAYEFVSNDTLYHHIHNRTSGMGRLSWDSRLRIAHESAGALAYLHTDARMSIIHRDVKSTNILLDENYTAKIADFGASRLVPLGHDEVVTLVQGTFGYLDPEYFHTGQLTDRSDVYSFGVVLAELLTGKKALGVERCVEDRSLATYFMKAKKENRLTEIIDSQVVIEATDEQQLKAACDLVCRCLNQVGVNRPSMKEVTMELETLRKFGKHPWISRDNERSSFVIETDKFDNYPLDTNSDTFGEYSSSSTSLMKEIMLQVQDPR